MRYIYIYIYIYIYRSKKYEGKQVIYIYIYIYIRHSTEFHAMVTTRYMIIREDGLPHENSCHANTFIILRIFHGKVGVY